MMLHWIELYIFRISIFYISQQLISSGTEAAVNHWYMNGDLKSKVPCTPTAVFSVAINTKSEANKVGNCIFC